MNFPKSTSIIALFCFFSSVALASTTSHFKFTVDLPEDWILISPEILAVANNSETLESLGIPEQYDKQISEHILNKIKSGKIEFYFDKNYLGSDYQNNVSIQLDSPILFSSLDELKAFAATECEGLPDALKEQFGEVPVMHACGLNSVNGMVVFSQSYTIQSENVVIAVTHIPMGDRFSFAIAAGAILDGKGEASVGDMHRLLIDSLTSYVVSNMGQKK